MKRDDIQIGVKVESNSYGQKYVISSVQIDSVGYDNVHLTSLCGREILMLTFMDLQKYFTVASEEESEEILPVPKSQPFTTEEALDLWCMGNGTSKQVTKSTDGTITALEDVEIGDAVEVVREYQSEVKEDKTFEQKRDDYTAKLLNNWLDLCKRESKKDIK